MTDWKSNKYWRNRPVEERLRNLRVPPRYKNCTFNNYDLEQGSEDFKKAIEETKRKLEHEEPAKEKPKKKPDWVDIKYIKPKEK